jgi:curved DNA-binding protein CbpA
MKTFYQLLEISPTAGIEEIKRAFRVQIARYHPDKVQHLGQEFQDMAAARAAELTEAYRVLSDENGRAAYDRLLAESAMTEHVPARSATAAAGRPTSEPHEPAATGGAPDGPQTFSGERATRDQVLRKATASRFRRVLEALAGSYDASEAAGFDFAWMPKSRLFGRSRGPRLAGRLVPRVDGDSVAGAWADAGRWAAKDEVCVFLMGSDLASAGELARAIADQRRSRPGRVTLIPVDARTWDAHLPTDAPVIVKTVLGRLKTGT